MTIPMTVIDTIFLVLAPHVRTAPSLAITPTSAP